LFLFMIVGTVAVCVPRGIVLLLRISFVVRRHIALLVRAHLRRPAPAAEMRVEVKSDAVEECCRATDRGVVDLG
jgi:hypothetical protein